MIRHIIMFKFKNAESEADRLDKIDKMKSAFGSMKNKINVVQSYKIGVNMKKTDFSYDLAIISEFKLWEDLETYLKHPEHQNAIGICKDIEKDKAVVDYEF